MASLADSAEATRVTLITGDTVHWRGMRNSQASIHVDPAPRTYPVEFNRFGTQDDFYIIPTDVAPHVATGAVDAELFNIPLLIRQGLDDQSAGAELPVILLSSNAGRGADELERAANALPAVSRAQAVASVNGVGAAVNRRKAAAFREAVLGRSGSVHGQGTEPRPLRGGVARILLDRVLEVDLDRSVPHIGAPTAWEAGYKGAGVTVAVVDTGIDAEHPDLQGRVAAAQDFTGAGDPGDDNGHGTHVASTIAGSGAASQGRFTGVAPGADLLNAKVCDPSGRCQVSDIMAGMEWAVDAGADVVNISLGGAPTDGTDPLSLLVDELSATTGALFVISAGNRGPGVQQIGAPGAASSALTVGATEVRFDRMAQFSSRGPRLGDHAFKPEIVAPGVDIVAARAHGTSLGHPVDSNYTAASGTSMAAPHVAGAAALLAQATGLSGQDLKDTLVSTAFDAGHDWFAQGTGRVDVAAALAGTVRGPAALNLGAVENVTERELTYTNRGDHDVTLTVDAQVTDLAGQVTAGVGLSSDTLTVPAGGQATLTLTVNPAQLSGQGPFGGIITATGPGVQVRTGVGFGSLLHTLTVEVLDSTGQLIGTPEAGEMFVHLVQETYDRHNPTGRPFYTVRTSAGVATAHVPPGSYTVATSVMETDTTTGRMSRLSQLVAAEVGVSDDVTVVLDARQAVPLEITVPDAVHKRRLETATVRHIPDAVTLVMLASGNRAPLHVTPAPPTANGTLAMWVHWTLAEPQPLRQQPWTSLPCEASLVRCISTTPAYIYNVPFFYSDRIPQSLHETFDRRDFVEVPTTYHVDRADVVIRRQGGALLFPPPFFMLFNTNAIWTDPGEVTEYYLASDDVLWSRAVAWQFHPEGAPPSGAPEFNLGLHSIDRFPALEAGGRRAEESWLSAPLRVGAADVREEALSLPRLATLSRGGVTGDEFLPGIYVMDNTRGHLATVPGLATWRMWNADTGEELVAEPVVPGIPLFRLDHEQATYRLEQTTQIPAQLREGLVRTGPATTMWMFTSAPSDAELPLGYRCPLAGGPCQIQPLIQLEYDLGLDATNAATAGGQHMFVIRAGHHTRTADRSPVTSMNVDVSFDEGQTWQEAAVSRTPTDTRDAGGFLPAAEPYQEFRVRVRHPDLDDTSGYVMLRVHAEDAAGGSVDQTVERAYALHEPVRGRTSEGPNHLS